MDNEDYEDEEFGLDDEEDEEEYSLSEEIFSEPEETTPAPLQYTLVGNEDGSQNLTVFRPGQKPLSAHSTHPNWEQIREGVLANDPSVIDMIDIALTAGQKFQRLTDRVASKNGYLYFDGEVVESGLADQVVRFLQEGVDDWKPLVNFFEKVMQNPNPNSRTELYNWLNAEGLTLTEDGDIVGYKGVITDSEGNLVSSSTGVAISNGEVFDGHIPNPIGAVVEMPRSEVDDNTARDCSIGLHVGTYSYASTFTNGPTLEVRVNPRDVVSVPRYDANKMRVCRYTVVKEVEEKYEEPVLYDEPEVETVDQVATTDTSVDVRVGDVFQDTDKRRPREVKVEEVNGDTVKAKSLSTGKTTTIAIARLFSRKYKRIRRGKKQK